MNIHIYINLPNGKELPLNVNENDTIENAKIKYNKENTIWTFNAEVLKNEKTFKDYEIEDDDVIICSYEVKGGCGIKTIDVSKNQMIVMGFNPSAPDYRYAIDGLNIISKCKKNKSCIANQQTIIVQIGFVTNWNLLDNLKKIKCPKCNERVFPSNFGFTGCKYKIDYEKVENDDEFINAFVEGEAGKEEFKKFDEYSGTANFTKLIFNISPY